MNAITTSVIRYGYAPFMIFGLNAAAYFIVMSQLSEPWYTWYFWLIPLLLIALATAYLAEQVTPWHSEWNDSHGDERTNFIHLVVYELQNIKGIIYIPLVTWLIPMDPVWPTSWPILAQLLLAIVITDFTLTFLHYLSHRLPILWRLHAVHHGVGRLYGMNGIIRHPIHQSVDLALGTAPLVIAGMPLPVAVLLGFAISVQLIVQHSNVSYALGPFRPHLSIGQIHHLHHVNWGKEGDCNFGLFFTIWDRLMGTFQADAPRPIQHHDMGVDELPNFPKSYIGQLLLPFRYRPGQGIQDLGTPAARARQQMEAAE